MTDGAECISNNPIYLDHNATARKQVAALLDCDDDEIIFTSGGTEANNLAIRGVTEAIGGRRQVVTTTIEHPATANPCPWLEQRGWRVTRVGVDGEGLARLDECGTAIGTELGVDLLSVAGHKLYAPKGVGALFVKRGTPLSPFALGAGHERGLRPGTENVASIVGLGVACEVAMRDLEASASRVRALRDELWRVLAASVPGLALNGDRERRLPNTLNVRFPRASGDAVLAAAPEVAASTGSACHQGREDASPVILAMGVAPADAIGSVRLSLGRGTTADDVTRTADALIRSWRRCVSEM